jgi:predicted component of type VI protein secretion system
VRLIERRLLRLNDEIQRLRREEELAVGELGFHLHLADDAIRDAAVTGSPMERADARDAAKDVARLESAVASFRRDLARLEAKRTVLLERLGS